MTVTLDSKVEAFVGAPRKLFSWGREMGHEVLNNYTEVKAVTTQL